MRYWAFILVIFSKAVNAQPINLPLNHSFEIQVLQIRKNNDSILLHTGFKPVLKNRADFSYESTINYRSLKIIKPKALNFLYRGFRFDDFLSADTGDFYIGANPMVNFSFGKGFSWDVNTRGVMVHGHIGKNFAFYSDFYENQAFFPEYIKNYISAYHVVPGQGRSRGFKGQGADFSNASGYISYTPFDFLNFQLGHGKHFVGEGYRSLLLSDNTFNYPFLKFTFTRKRFQYTHIYTAFQEVSAYDNRLQALQRSYGSFTNLNWLPVQWMEIGIFEGIVWKTADSLNNNYLTWNYANPVILFNTLQYGLNDENNILLGLHGKIKPVNNIHVYGQVAADNPVFKDIEAPEHKTGWMAGMKIINILDFFSGFPYYHYLFLQGEYSTVSPYCYGHREPLQKYAHFNQPLAHPLGANFKEQVLIARYRLRDFFFEYQWNHAVVGADTGSTHYGSNIFVSDRNYSDFPDKNYPRGIETEIFNHNFQVSYLLNPKTQLKIFLQYHYRKYKNNLEQSDTEYIVFGIRTCLRNFYYDF